MANGEYISKENAKQLIDRYKGTYGESIKRAFLYDNDLVEGVLNGDNCEGLRIYMGLNEDEEQCVVLVGTDSEGDDLTNNLILEIGKPCPPFCSASGYFNT